MEIEKSTTDKSKLILVIAVIILTGALFGAVGYLLGSKNNNDVIKLENQLTENQKIDQDVEVEKGEDNNEDNNEEDLNNSEEDDVEIIEDVKDETADWKTYQNEEYGFEMKYPKGWSYVVNNYENQQLISFCDGKCKGEGEAVFTTNQNVSFEERYNNIKQLIEKDFPVTESSISIGGVEGKILVIKNTIGFSRLLSFEKNNYVYDFTMMVGKESLFDQMLSTFKFTN